MSLSVRAGGLRGRRPFRRDFNRRLARGLGHVPIAWACHVVDHKRVRSTALRPLFCLRKLALLLSFLIHRRLLISFGWRIAFSAAIQ